MIDNIKNWKIIIFVVLIFVFTIILAIVQQIINIDYEIITLPQLGPALAYFVTIILFKNMYIPIRISFNKIILLKIFLSIIVPLILFSVTYYIGNLLNMNDEINNDIHSVISVMLFGIIIGSIGEEIGWRSFFQPILEYKYTRLISAIIVGFIWGLWHINHYKNGLLFMLFFLLFTISSSIIIVYILKDTQNNILLSSLFHASINIEFRIFFDANLINVNLFIINGIVWLIPAIIIIIIKRKYYIKNNGVRTNGV
jgi:membrane protease YdiL (CAAX protease family)